MTKTNTIYTYLLLSIGISSCNIFQKMRKNELEDGFYIQKSGGVTQKVYVDNDETDIKVYDVRIMDRQWWVDTTHPINTYGNEITAGSMTIFKQVSFDLDFLTIPLKFRPAHSDVPAQLNANLNGALFAGYRIDRYYLSSAKTPLGLNSSERSVNHFAVSFGAFSGLGNTAITPTTTANMVVPEYDGIVWSSGIAGIVAVNNVTVGLAIGFDQLLDKNKKLWIYQNKPWLGLSFGLNLN